MNTRTPVMAVATVTVLLAAVGCGSGGAVHKQATQKATQNAAQRTTPSTTATPATRTVSWNGVSFEVPKRWAVNETNVAWPHPSSALIEGPFLGTLRTGPMCRDDHDGTGSCGRGNGILDRRPTDGVVAWVDAASPDPITKAGDPGPSTGACPGRPTTIHVYRELGAAGHRVRAALDGCAYGPHAQLYLAELRQMAESLRPA